MAAMARKDAEEREQMKREALERKRQWQRQSWPPWLPWGIAGAVLLTVVILVAIFPKQALILLIAAVIVAVCLIAQK